MTNTQLKELINGINEKEHTNFKPTQLRHQSIDDTAINYIVIVNAKGEPVSIYATDDYKSLINELFYNDFDVMFFETDEIKVYEVKDYKVLDMVEHQYKDEDEQPYSKEGLFKAIDDDTLFDYIFNHYYQMEKSELCDLILTILGIGTDSCKGEKDIKMYYELIKSELEERWS